MIRFTIWVIFLFCIQTVLAQELQLNAESKPLNMVLRSLPVEISFNDDGLSKYQITVHQKFDNPTAALRFLLKDKPFSFEVINGVYVIIPVVQQINEKPQFVEEIKYYAFSGIIKDAHNGERLSYAYVTLPEGTFSSDEGGYFSFKRLKSEAISVKVEYLGYEACEAMIIPGLNEINLSAKTYDVDEVVIRSSPSTMLIQSGNNPGEIRINHQVAKYIPGSVDNSVFNLMRMMPGIRASGEPSEDLIVWGSNRGESKIMYDGYTIFGIKNYNDHIGSINPYMVKDIRIMKGGYASGYGEKIGAITEITGIDGDFNLPSVKTNLSNYTLNLFVSTPVTKKINVSAAYRQTFYNLYKITNVEISGDDNDTANLPLQTNIYLKPVYEFRDVNLKLSGKAFHNDSYYISFYGADDRFKYSVKQPDEYDINAAEKNRQYGGATSYKKVWDNGTTTKFLANFSRLTSLLDNLTIVGDRKPVTEDVSHLDNVVQEFSLKLNHHFSLGRNKLEIGGEWQQYRVKLNDLCGEMDKPAFYINDNLILGKLSADVGVRVDATLNKKFHVQPRIGGRYNFSENITGIASWGIYNQFLTRTTYQYDEEGFQTVWSMADSTFTKATHTTAGIGYSKNGLLISTEGYMKRTKNGQYFLDNKLYKLDNTIIGVDVFVKKQISLHTIYGAYSITNLRKPTNETSHEIKFGGILNVNPFHFSWSYVYGTGFGYITSGGHGHGQDEEEQHGTDHKHSDSSDESYSRLDIGTTYSTYIKRVKINTGISLLNILNTKNIKYNYQISGQNSATNIFTKATPFTPTVFFEIIF